MKNLNISNSTFYNIKNMKFTLIDTGIAKNINLIHAHLFELHQSPNYWSSTVKHRVIITFNL